MSVFVLQLPIIVNSTIGQIVTISSHTEIQQPCAVYRQYLQSYRHQICDFEMRVNEMLAIVVLYDN